MPEVGEALAGEDGADALAEQGLVRMSALDLETHSKVGRGCVGGGSGVTQR